MTLVSQDSIEEQLRQILVEAHGCAHAIPIRTLRSATGLPEAQIKSAIGELVARHRIPIGSIQRGESVAYFMAETESDLAIARQPIEDQLVRMIRRLNGLCGPEYVAEFLSRMPRTGKYPV